MYISKCVVKGDIPERIVHFCEKVLKFGTHIVFCMEIHLKLGTQPHHHGNGGHIGFQNGRHGNFSSGIFWLRIGIDS